MYLEINAAIQSLKVVSDCLNANKELTNYNELVAAVSEVSAKLTNANSVALASQEKQSFLSDKVRELEQQITEFENFEAELQKYEPYQFTTGSLAFVQKEGVQGINSRHYLCDNCASNHQISRMQPDGFYNEKSYFLKCHKCSLFIQTSPSSSALLGSIKAGIIN